VNRSSDAFPVPGTDARRGAFGERDVDLPHHAHLSRQQWARAARPRSGRRGGVL